MLQPIGGTGPNAFIRDQVKYQSALQLLRESLDPAVSPSLLAMDDCITWMRSYSFLRDDWFLSIINNPEVSDRRKSCIWRLYIAICLAKAASRNEGDFIEAGCLDGFTANKIDEFLNLQNLRKNYFLFDLFEWKPGDPHKNKPGLQSASLYDQVKETFDGRDHVHVLKGDIKETLLHSLPDKLAFVHIDLNHAQSELFVLQNIAHRMASGGIVLLDDYGWLNFADSKIALDGLIERLSLPRPIELPTGQAFLLF
jgi:O-methyltransferase